MTTMLLEEPVSEVVRFHQEYGIPEMDRETVIPKNPSRVVIRGTFSRNSSFGG